MNRPDPSLQQQATIRTFLRIGGPIVLGVGLILAVIAFASFFASFNNPGLGMPDKFWLGIIGLPMIGIGGSMVKVGYLGPASRYVAGELTPTLRDTLGAIGVGKAETVCPACGHHNDSAARFCNSCGKPLGKTCAACGTENDPNASFCAACGKPLPA